MPSIKIANNAGFCFGVKRAIEIAEEVAEKNQDTTYVLGQLVHNERVINELESKGIVFVDDIKSFKLGDKYRFLIKVLDFKTTGQILNDVKLIFYERINEDLTEKQ